MKLWIKASCVAVVLLGGLVGGASAASWINAGTGSWFTGTNWDTGTVPGPGEIPFISNGGTAVLDGPGANPDYFMIANGGNGNLVVTPAGSARLTYDIRMGMSLASDTGVMTVQGGSVTCRWMQIGLNGSGTLAITGGIVRAIGPGSMNAFFGYGVGGIGILNLSGGGTMESANDMIFSYASNSATYLNIAGGTLRGLAGSCYLAFAQNTTCTVVQTGGIVDVPVLNMNWDPSGAGYVEYHLGGGTNYIRSSINNVYGNVKIVVTNGALLMTNDLLLANGANSRGVLEQSGGTISVGEVFYMALGADTTNSATLSGGTLRVGIVAVIGRGARAAANLTLTNNANMTVIGEVRVSDGASSTGTVTIAGGYLNASNSNFAVGQFGHGRLIMTGGRLDYSTMKISQFSGARGDVNLSGGILKGGIISNPYGNSIFSFTGGTLAANEIDATLGSLTNSGGTVSPGYDGIGVTLVENGNYTETSAQCAINVQLGGTTQGTQYDWLNVPAGTVTIQGNLAIRIVNGYAAAIQPSDKFYVVEAANTIAGAFNNVPSGGRLRASGGGTFAVYYGAGSGSEAPNKVTLTGFQRDGTLVIVR